MAEIGKYSKAYYVKQFRQYKDWAENTSHLRQASDSAEARTQLTDDDYLFLQQNYVVTDGIYLDEYVVFDNITAEWVTFCRQTLQFGA